MGKEKGEKQDKYKKDKNKDKDHEEKDKKDKEKKDKKDKGEQSCEDKKDKKDKKDKNYEDGDKKDKKKDKQDKKKNKDRKAYVPEPNKKNKANNWQPVSKVGNTPADDIIEIAKKNGGLFVDAEFPANDRSLALKEKPASPIVWKRPKDLSKNPQFFVDGTESGDIIQGQLGDCWFLGALAVVATRSDLIKETVVSAHPEYGFYQFRLYKNGKWRVITVSDEIPCIQRGTSFSIWASSCKDSNEFWVPLIEKAYAKLHGSYGSLEGGWTADGFVDLTGGISEKVEFSSNAPLWEIIQNCVQEKWLMGCSATGGKEADSGKGILTGHAYSILNAREYRKERLIQIRNPWGQKEWTGRWSDKSKEMDDAARKDLNHASLDDGTFWMCFDDFKTNYSRMFICRLYNDNVGTQYSRYICQGEWAGNEAGGCFNFATWKENPQYGLIVDKPTNVLIAMTQEDNRITTCQHRELYPIGFSVSKTSDCSNRLQVCAKSNVIAQVPDMYTPTREAMHDFKRMEKGQYIIVPTTFKAGCNGKFWITVLSQDPVQFSFIDQKGNVAECAAVELQSDYCINECVTFNKDDNVHKS